MDWQRVDKAGEEVDGEDYKAVRFFLEGAPFICH